MARQFWLVCAVAFSFVAWPANGSGQEKELSLVAELDKRDYILAEPIWVRCSLINNSKKRVVAQLDSGPGIEFIIVNSNGVRIPRCSPRIRSDSISPYACTIDPGQRKVGTVDLYDSYGIDRAGVYEITLNYISEGDYRELDGRPRKPDDPPGWKGTLETTLGKVTIAHPTDPRDIEALKFLEEKAPGRRADPAYQERIKYLSERWGGDVLPPPF
ncbi:MAG: hypothetical protein NTV79_00775, partial [Candidatus Aureabacteria bacterium]|nr:hypothetical protein [Candidatus Auribacterota bacterium]